MMIHQHDEESWYLAGPMTGIKAFNFPKFDRIASDLRSQGHKIVSPAELDAPVVRKSALQSPDGCAIDLKGETSETWGTLLARDIIIVADQVTGVIVMDGWQNSRGARLETFVAFLCRKPIRHYPSWRKVRKRDLIKAWLGEWYGASS